MMAFVSSPRFCTINAPFVEICFKTGLVAAFWVVAVPCVVPRIDLMLSFVGMA